LPGGNFWVNGYCQSGCLGSVVGGVVQTKFQCCRVYSETSSCNAQLTTDPTYGCGTSAMRADAAAYGVDPSAFVCTGYSQCATGSGSLQYPIPEYQGEVAARVVGHIANLAFSLLLYPVSKHSPWLSVFGIGFPHALKFHRLMGIVGFLFATLHMFIWYGQWVVQGTLWSNVVTVNFNRISPVNIHWDNWTIMLMQLLWLLTVPALVVAALYRNSPRMYLLFLRLHYFPIIFAVAGMVHAFSNWFYVAPPMLLFYLDHLARVRRKALLPNAINVTVQDDVVKIEFPQLAHYAGQYCYICCPALSPLHLHSMTDWHPFTVASAPAPASHTTFVTIKCTGPGSWTQQLLQHVTMCNRNGLPVPEIWIDGFYGQVPDVTQAKVVICMAGGIGVTPFASLLQQLLHSCRKPGNSARMPHVHFVWSLRSLSLLQLYQPVIEQCLSADGSATSPFSCTVDLRLHLTVAPSDRCDHSPLPPFVHRGRPDSPNAFQSVGDRVATGELSSSHVLVFACGPQELVDQASELYFKHSFSFYKEEFHM
jgi:predicted ferric reductase